MSNIRLFPENWPSQFAITPENNSTIFSGLGLGKITDCISCTVTEERNGSFELEMDYPVTGIRYSQLALRMIIVAPPNPYDNPQAFRIYSISKQYGGKVKVKAQHISYDLSDIMMKKGELQDDSLNPKKIWDYATSNLASGFSVNRTNTNYQFTFSSDLTISDAIENSEGNKTNKWVLKGPKSIKNILLGNSEDGLTKIYQVGNNNGEEPEFRFDNFVISLNKNRGTNRNVSIKYGKNMKGFTQEESLEKIYTHVYPFYYASSITDYEGGYGSGAQRTYNDWACDLTDWINSSYQQTGNPLVETGLKQDDGSAFSFKRILALDVSSLYKGDYGIDLDKIGRIARFNQWGHVVGDWGSGNRKIEIEPDGGSYTFEDYDVYAFDGGVHPNFITECNDTEFEASHYRINGNYGLSVSIESIFSSTNGHAYITGTITNNTESKITLTPTFGRYDADGDYVIGYDIGDLQGDNETDTNHSYFYDLTKPEDVSKIAGRIEKPAKRYIRENHMARFPVQLKIDMSLAEPTNIKSLYDIRLCDLITVVYPAFNVSSIAKCTKTTYDCMNERYKTIDFSNAWSGLAFATAMNIDSTKRSIANLNYINPALGYVSFLAAT